MNGTRRSVGKTPTVMGAVPCSSCTASTDGRAELTEETLDHLERYRGSRPVRIGNGAHRQLQLDIYGELMDAAYLHNKYVEPISYDGWTRLRRLVDWLCGNWKREDEGIWEVRSGRQHFVYSKVMSWVALDRSLRLADKRSAPDFDRRHYKLLFTRAHRDASGAAILKTAYGLEPILRVSVDIAAAEVTAIESPPRHVIWGDIPTPLF